MGTGKIIGRTCIGCGKVKDKRELIRIVKNKEGQISVDKTGRAPGRGTYICDDKECFKKMHKSRGLDRTFKTSVLNEVYASLEEEING